MSRFEKKKNDHKPIMNREKQLSKAHNDKGRKSSTGKGKKSPNLTCKEGCKKHQFELKAIDCEAGLKELSMQTTINFCNNMNSTIPLIPRALLNQPHVPLFLSQVEIEKYTAHLPTHRQQFSEAITKGHQIDQVSKNQQILRPIPKLINCQICRVKNESLEEYQKHIKTLGHIKTLRSSLGQKYIDESKDEFEGMHKSSMIEIQKQKLRDVCDVLKEAKKMLKSLLKK